MVGGPNGGVVAVVFGWKWLKTQNKERNQGSGNGGKERGGGVEIAAGMWGSLKFQK